MLCWKSVKSKQYTYKDSKYHSGAIKKAKKELLIAATANLGLINHSPVNNDAFFPNGERSLNRN